MKGETWQVVDQRLTVVRLSTFLKLLIPGLWVSTIPQRTRAASYEGGTSGLAIGGALVVGAVAMGLILYSEFGIASLAAGFWLMGGTGIVMIVSSARPLAFVKPICVSCRLLSVIREHESIHISGVEADADVWKSMKTRHSCESLRLEGDPAICSFCPIPMRLKEP